MLVLYFWNYAGFIEIELIFLQVAAVFLIYYENNVGNTDVFRC